MSRSRRRGSARYVASETTAARARTGATRVNERPDLPTASPCRAPIDRTGTDHELALGRQPRRTDVHLMELEVRERTPVLIDDRGRDVHADQAPQGPTPAEGQEQLAVAAADIKDALERNVVGQLQDEAPAMKGSRRIADHVAPLRPAALVVDHAAALLRARQVQLLALRWRRAISTRSAFASQRRTVSCDR